MTDNEKLEPKTWEGIARALFNVLDDIDTADDLAKDNENLYRNLVRRHHKRRFDYASTDGYEVRFNTRHTPDTTEVQVKPLEEAKRDKDQAYEERNRLVALLAKTAPSGIATTNIEGWNPEWHGAVYIDFPWGQASWHFHDSQRHLFDNIPPYDGEWDGHTTEEKYQKISDACSKTPFALARALKTPTTKGETE